MAKELCVEVPGQGDKYHPWTAETKQLFALDSGDVELLEADKIVWREGTAFTLVDEDA